MNRVIGLFAGAARSVLAGIAPAFAESGYFVIVSSTPLGSEYDHQSAGWAADCGYEVSEGQTYRGSGFTPNLYILYVGPFRSTWIANQVLDEILPCVPDAYVKEGKL
jgi:hypothetical protein